MGVSHFFGTRTLLPIIIIAWLIALVPGVRYLLTYEYTPGKMEAAPVSWPSRVPFEGDASLPTLVVVLHPRCSCSKATLTELEEAASGFNHPYNALMLIYQPRGEKYNWQHVITYREAQQALHAKVVMDDDGELAAGFGALTSGEVLYYSASDPLSTKKETPRRLLFSGGVTGSRGMVGENAGVEALKTAVNGTPRYQRIGKTIVSTAVYGCGFATLGGSNKKQETP